MSQEDIKKQLIAEYLQNASPEEQEEFIRLMKERKNNTPFGGINLNLGQVAKNMAESIHKQMGLTTANMKQMAKNCVIQLARQYNPELTDFELQAIVKQMVPEHEPKMKKLPPDIVLEMIDQFVSYGQGKMTQSELAGLPNDWTEKYWEAFTVDVQKIIRGYLKGQINRNQFWGAIHQVLGID